MYNFATTDRINANNKILPYFFNFYYLYMYIPVFPNFKPIFQQLVPKPTLHELYVNF